MRALKKKIVITRGAIVTLLFRCAATAFLVTVAFCRLADANAPTGRYTTSTGTVYDTKTKLTWQQTSPSTTYAVATGTAAAYCTSLSSTLGGLAGACPRSRSY
jgi:hypothetical protein